MNNKVMYMTFYENWVEVMEMCTPEEWYELCKIITNLRFKGIDTDAKTISNIKIKMAWNLIRPSILKSNRDKRYNDTKRNGVNAEETKKSVITDVKTTEFDIPNCQISNSADLSPSNNEEVEQPQLTVDNTTEAIKRATEEFITDEEKYGIDVVDLIDENPEIINALNVVVEYRCGDHSKLMEAQGANSKIERIVKSKSLDADFNSRVERFCADYIKQYTEYVYENKKVKQIA